MSRDPTPWQGTPVTAPSWGEGLGWTRGQVSIGFSPCSPQEGPETPGGVLPRSCWGPRHLRRTLPTSPDGSCVLAAALCRSLGAAGPPARPHGFLSLLPGLLVP